MCGILSINETFLLLPNQSLSIEYKPLSCVSNMKIWLIIHFIITRFVENYLFLQIICPLQFIITLYFNRYWRRIRNIIESNWSDIYNLDTYSLMIIVLKKEMKLIFVYVYMTFLYTWLQFINSNYRVTYFNFLRWLIEASLLPQILIITLFVYFVCAAEENLFHLYHTFYVRTIIIKLPLFILMRFAESQSDFFLNALQTLFFRVFCYFSSK
jgi:hypothetical protein